VPLSETVIWYTVPLGDWSRMRGAASFEETTLTNARLIVSSICAKVFDA
jgi:hypothetical protein